MAIQSVWIDPSGGSSHEPELRHGVRRLSDRHRVAIGALGEWLVQRQRRPVFLVDRHLTVICSNSAAREVLERSGWLRLIEPQLEILDSDLRQKLQDAFESWPNPNSVSISLSFGSRTVDLTILELSCGLPKVYVLEIIQPIEAAVISRLLIRKFRLTKVQAKVAVLLYNGADSKSIAARLSVKVNTVRTHKAAVFKKVGVRSQPGLIREVGAAVDRSYVG